MNLPAGVDDERAWIHACACGKRSCSKKSVKKRPSAAPQGGKATAKLVSKKTRRGRKAATSMELEWPSDNQEDDTLFLVVPGTDIDTASEDEDEEMVKRHWVPPCCGDLLTTQGGACLQQAGLGRHNEH